MDLRSGTEGDAHEVAAVFQAARATMQYLPVLHTAAETTSYFAQQLSECASFVAVKDHAIVGFAVFGGGWLRHLYVSEPRQGIGSALLAAVKARSPAGLELWMFQENAGARKFYERRGFAVVEETDGRGNEEQLPDARYRWHAT